MQQSRNHNLPLPQNCYKSPIHDTKMLGKKLGSMKKLGSKKKLGSMKILAKKVKSIGSNEASYDDNLLGDDGVVLSEACTTPIGTFPMYVGKCRQRFVVPTGYLSHPLFKIMLERAYNEFGFDQTNVLVVPCSVAAFEEVINAIQCCNPKFDFGELVQEFI
ncbi:auxin-responsive protein SAUR50-like [Salvia hispanica]|uniref:auxin-responsive protein SAUR50-like n=1 Tax=Salvia hispanica TaxID=49212 RepID=UPI002009587F|nr:auxin-responsive protein SAUR50-like [Salvia hispanica]